MPDSCIWACWIPHPMQDAEFHVFHRMIFLCKMPTDLSGLISLEFLDTTVVFIHPISDRSFGFSSVLEATLVAINDVNHI